MDTYSVETDATGCKVRRVPEDGGLGETVATFPTRREAAEWVNAQIQTAMKSANASDVA
jgi:hypothetical protein